VLHAAPVFDLSLADGCQPNNSVFKSTNDAEGAVACGFTYSSTEKTQCHMECHVGRKCCQDVGIILLPAQSIPNTPLVFDLFGKNQSLLG
jgi:hypothetical protein